MSGQQGVEIIFFELSANTILPAGRQVSSFVASLPRAKRRHSCAFCSLLSFPILIIFVPFTIGNELNSEQEMTPIQELHASFMRPLLFTILILLFVSNLSGQISFSNIGVNLKTIKIDNSTELICTDSTFSIKFQLKQRDIQLQNNFATVDSQLIQIAALKIGGYEKTYTNLTINDQKQLLEKYSSYELDYFKNNLNIEVINPNNQWVMAKSRQWLVWYFRVGNLPIQLDKKTEIQLFASTIIADKVLTINAPIQSGGDFTKAGLIVNEMMESLTNNINN